MEHKSLDTLRSVATLHELPEIPLRTRAEKLERWAQVLEREPKRLVRTLHQIEFAPASERPGARVDGSALALAAQDPVLRAAGLADDSFGEATRFFDLNEDEAHRLLCSCLNGHAVEGGTLARQVRSIAAGHRMPTTAAALYALPLLCAVPLVAFLVR